MNSAVGEERGTHPVSARDPLEPFVMSQLMRLNAMSTSVIKSGETPMLVPHRPNARTRVTAAVPASTFAGGASCPSSRLSRFSMVPTDRRLPRAHFQSNADFESLPNPKDDYVDSIGSSMRAVLRWRDEYSTHDPHDPNMGRVPVSITQTV